MLKTANKFYYRMDEGGTFWKWPVRVDRTTTSKTERISDTVRKVITVSESVVTVMPRQRVLPIVAEADALRCCICGGPTPEGRVAALGPLSTDILCRNCAPQWYRHFEEEASVNETLEDDTGFNVPVPPDVDRKDDGINHQLLSRWDLAKGVVPEPLDTSLIEEVPVSEPKPGDPEFVARLDLDQVLNEMFPETDLDNRTPG